MRQIGTTGNWRMGCMREVAVGKQVSAKRHGAALTPNRGIAPRAADVASDRTFPAANDRRFSPNPDISWVKADKQHKQFDRLGIIQLAFWNPHDSVLHGLAVLGCKLQID
jgi:hypothetical protein